MVARTTNMAMVSCAKSSNSRENLVTFIAFSNHSCQTLPESKHDCHAPAGAKEAKDGPRMRLRWADDPWRGGLTRVTEYPTE